MMQSDPRRQSTACFTGHREIPTEEIPRLEMRLREEILRLYGIGVRNFGAGGALGFDTIAAEAVLALRDGGYPELRLILVLPCRNQADRWSAADRARYEETLARADKTVYTSEAYFRGCMQKRNRHLIDESAYCIAYLTHQGGGTAYTVRYAEKQGVSVTILP